MQCIWQMSFISRATCHDDVLPHVNRFCVALTYKQQSEKESYSNILFMIIFQIFALFVHSSHFSLALSNWLTRQCAQSVVANEKRKSLLQIRLFACVRPKSIEIWPNREFFNSNHWHRLFNRHFGINCPNWNWTSTAWMTVANRSMDSIRIPMQRIVCSKLIVRHSIGEFCHSFASQSNRFIMSNSRIDS